LHRVADLSIGDLADKVDDLSRLIGRQSGLLLELSDARRRPGPDTALLVELHALRGDALAAASATRSARERGAVEAIADRLERLLAGRGGVLVAPRPGHPFSTATMEAAEEVACADAALDRTVAALLAPGLEADGRTVRLARVTVNRYTARPPEPVLTDEPGTNGQPAADTARTGRTRNERTPDPEPTADSAATNGRASRARTRRPAQPDDATVEPAGRTNRTRTARRTREPEPTQADQPAGAGSSDTPPAKSPAKRASRKQPAPEAQTTPATTS